jgi:hypothetical protein
VVLIALGPVAVDLLPVAAAVDLLPVAAAIDLLPVAAAVLDLLPPAAVALDLCFQQFHERLSEGGSELRKK